MPRIPDDKASLDEVLQPGLKAVRGFISRSSPSSVYRFGGHADADLGRDIQHHIAEEESNSVSMETVRIVGTQARLEEDSDLFVQVTGRAIHTKYS